MSIGAVCFSDVIQDELMKLLAKNKKFCRCGMADGVVDRMVDRYR